MTRSLPNVSAFGPEEARQAPEFAVMGAPVSSGNRGVLALGASLLNLCAEALPASKPVLLLGNRTNDPVRFRIGGIFRQVQVVNTRLSPRAKASEHLFTVLLAAMSFRLIPNTAFRRWLIRQFPWIRVSATAALVGDVRGGDSFSDIYGMKRFLIGFAYSWSVILVRGELVHFPQTYGPYNSWIARSLAGYLLRRSSAIVARDRHSQLVAQELVGSAKLVTLSPDVAFSLESVQPASVEVDGEVSPFPVGVIGLNVNGLMFNGGYTKSNMFGLKLDYPGYLVRLITKLLSISASDVWLFPHTYAPMGDVESDNEASDKVRAALPVDLRRRVRVVTGVYDQHEIKWLIGQCDFFVGSRMHACIAALSQGVPCVGVAYSLKFAGVFESVGMDDWVVEARSLATEEAVVRTLDLFKSRDAARPRLRARADSAREELRIVFQSLLQPSSEARSAPQETSFNGFVSAR